MSILITSVKYLATVRKLIGPMKAAFSNGNYNMFSFMLKFLGAEYILTKF